MSASSRASKKQKVADGTGSSKLAEKSKEESSSGADHHQQQQQQNGKAVVDGALSTTHLDKPRVTVVKVLDHEISVSDLRKLYLSGIDGSYVLPTTGATIELGPRRYPPVRRLPPHQKKRILVTGGAGFVGSHLVDRLMLMGHFVICLDNFFTGTVDNIMHWMGHPNFELIRHDVVDPIVLECDQIYHLACPASPPHYQYNQIKTVKTSVMGTLNMLGLAKRVKARFLLSSTSEVYGDPEVHPQVEEYWGNVNPIGLRSCYDEGKRVSETLSYCYQRQNDVDVRVARIFNTYGPRMNGNDGRVVSNFIMQALQGQKITIYGDGTQTRSFQFVHDLVSGLISLMESDYTLPVNIGNPEEYTILHFAEYIRDFVNRKVELEYHPPISDDPHKRKPDIAKAKEKLNWEPHYSVRQGIEETVQYFRSVLGKKE